MRVCSLFPLVIGEVAARLRGGNAVSPVEKVINLLKQLQAETEQQGKEEAAQYDKFSCFCKENADEKQYQIEKSDKKINKLTQQIERLDGELNELSQNIQKRAKEIKKLDGKIDSAATARADGHAAYKVNDADVSGAIASLRAAIKALKDSKSSMKGAKLDNNLLEVGQVARRALKLVQSSKDVSPTEDQVSKMVALAQIDQNPPSYEYRSNDIIQTLVDLLDMFLKNKKGYDNDEFEARAAWEKEDLNFKNIRKFAKKDKSELEAVSEKKSEEKSQAEQDKDEETKDKNADSAFLNVLKGECESKAEAWDQRSQVRADELKAMSEALVVLTERVSPSWGANKKLAGLQRPASLLQLHRGESSGVAAVHKAMALLEQAAKRTGSRALAGLAVRASVSEDHFVKVRGLIKDLIDTLRTAAEAEASEKSFCDDAMKKNVDNRDEAKLEIESLSAEKRRDEIEKQKLTAEVAELSQDIAGLNKALNEATELRNQEKAENLKTIETAEEGREGTETALQILKEFYEGAGGSFVQSKFVPKNSDREGKTFADRAPEVFDNDGYEGQQTGSKGILGLLEVIQSDFERTIQTTKDNEQAAQDEFRAFEQGNKNAVNEKETSKEDKESRITEVKDEITDGQDGLQEQNGLLQTAEDQLVNLKTRCVDGEETYAERVAKREKEIASLKEALQILIDWQGF